jgi:hypothetical protein
MIPKVETGFWKRSCSNEKIEHDPEEREPISEKIMLQMKIGAVGRLPSACKPAIRRKFKRRP